MVKIENIIETTDFRAPNKRVAMLEVHYLTDKGYRGSVLLEKEGASKESIIEAVKKASSVPDSLIGQTIAK
jgi:hypothetical protein